jgi:hypothetical protein
MRVSNMADCALCFVVWALSFGLWALGFGLWALGFGLWALSPKRLHHRLQSVVAKFLPSPPATFESY